jgi:hypothetical protein
MISLLHTFSLVTLTSLAPDPNYFSLDVPESFFSVFNPEASALLDYELETMAKKV